MDAKMDANDVDRLIDQSERLGVVGSPSSTAELALDILGPAVTRKLVGELALFRFPQDGVPNYALGQITEVQLKNVWHEDPTMRSLIRQRGRIDAVSERQDTHLGKMVISAVFQRSGKYGFEPSILGTVPSTGTSITQVDDNVLDGILSPYRDQLFYLGRVYGSRPKLPLWFKHFDKGHNGAGEAYHLGIFGKTGSGKSVLAKMVLLAYSRYSQMAVLVIDPQGEFSKEMHGGAAPGEFTLPVGNVVRNLGKRPVVLTVRNLVLDRWDLFQEILVESIFFRELQVLTRDKAELAADVLVRAMMDSKKIALSKLQDRDQFDEVFKLLEKPTIRNKIYVREGSAAERFDEAVQQANREEIYARVWLPLARLFSVGGDKSKKKVDDALKWLLTGDPKNRPILVVNLAREEARDILWNDKIQALVIKRLLEGITFAAEQRYQEGQSLNTLVVIDEAHRLAARHIPREDDAARRVRSVLIDAARTTRKYGLGWLFISQTLSSIDAEILQQLRISLFGFGLGLGQEFDSLRQLVGSSSTALDLYQSFRDPHSAFDTASRQYSFMTIGPVSPLSFSGTPLFFNAFNTTDAFIEANNLPIGK